MEMLMQMFSEEMEKQMEAAMKMLTERDMLETMMEHSDDILKTLDKTLDEGKIVKLEGL